MASAFKDRLVGALHDAVQEFNANHNPTDAVVKAARACDFNVDQTHRLVEMFNTARTLNHYKHASDRGAEFELADPDAVVAALFEGDEKSAGAAVPDYGCYDERERDWHFRGDTDAVKVAAAAEQDLTLEALGHRAMTLLRERRQLCKIAEDEGRLAGSAAAGALTKLARQFSLTAAYDSDRNARVMAAASRMNLGAAASKLAEFVPAKDKPAPAVLAKYAAAAVIDDRDLGAELGLLKEAAEWLGVQTELEAAASVFGKEADAFERDYADACGIQPAEPAGLADMAVLKQGQATTKRESEYTATNMFGDPEKVKTVRESGTELPTMFDTIPAYAGKALAKPLEAIDVDRAFTGDTTRQNKALSERMRNVQRQIMLQDLMTNDQVLSEESPEQVAEAYQAILQLAPEMASSKEVVRAILRQTVHSTAVSPYDAEIWTKLEKNLQNLRGKTPVREAGQ